MTQTQTTKKDIISNFNYVLTKSKNSKDAKDKMKSIHRYHITLHKKHNNIIHLIDRIVREDIINKFRSLYEFQDNFKHSNKHLMLYPKNIHDFYQYLRDNSPKPDLKDLYIFLVCSYLKNDGVPYTKIYLYRTTKTLEGFKELIPMLYNYETSIRLYNNIRLQDLIAFNYCDISDVKTQLLNIHKEPKHNNLNIIHIDNNKYNNDPNNLKLSSPNDNPNKSNHNKYEIIYYKGSTDDLHEITTINDKQLKQPIYISNDKDLNELQLYKRNKQGYKQLHKYNSNIGTYYKTKDKNNKTIFINDDLLKSLI